jgi:hypothetical protein
MIMTYVTTKAVTPLDGTPSPDYGPGWNHWQTVASLEGAELPRYLAQTIKERQADPDGSVGKRGR